jgi:non-canonical poly(A) RNA polymerase PAPD5/7
MVRPLGLALKQFLVMRGLNEVFSGGLGSYGLVSIITSFLQMHPKIQVGFVRQEDNLGVLLMEFFELYGKRFNYDIVGIDIRHSGEYFLKHKRTFEQYGRENAYDRLCVQDPEDESK